MALIDDLSLRAISVPSIVGYYTDEELNSGYHAKVEYQQAIDRYGTIYKVIDFNDLKNKDEIIKAAREWIKEHYFDGVLSFNVKAVDLHLLGYDVDKIRVGDQVTVEFIDLYNVPVRKTLTCLSVQMDILNPGNTTYKIGIPDSSLNTKFHYTNNRSSTGSNKSSSYNNSVGGGVNQLYKLYKEIDSNAKIEAEKLELLLNQMDVQAANVAFTSAASSNTQGSVREIQGSAIYQNQAEIIDVVGVFNVVDNYYDDWPLWDSDVLYKRGDRVRYEGKGYLCIRDIPASPVIPVTDDRYWTEVKGRKGVELINGAAFELDDYNGARITVGEKLGEHDKHFAEYDGSALWTQRDHITGVAGEYDIYTDPTTGKKTLIIKSGGGLEIERDDVRFGLYDAGNLTGGVLVDKINISGWAEWNPTAEYYPVGAKVTRRGIGYICTVAHRENGTFNPAQWEEYHATDTKILGDYVSIKANQVAELGVYVDNQITGGVIAEKVNMLGFAEWTSGKHYKVGDKIKYEGRPYECIEEHDSVSPFDPSKWKTYHATKINFDQLDSNVTDYTAMGLYDNGTLTGGILVQKINDRSTTTKISGDRVDIEASQVRIGSTSTVEAWMGATDIWKNDTDETLEDYEGLIADRATIGQLNTANARISSLEATAITVSNLSASIGNINRITTKSVDIGGDLRVVGDQGNNRTVTLGPNTYTYMSNPSTYDADGHSVDIRMALYDVDKEVDGDQITLVFKTIYGDVSQEKRVTFSKAASITNLSGAWSGSTLTVSTNPDTGKTYSIGFTGNPDQLLTVLSNGTPTLSETNEKYLNVPLRVASISGSTPPTTTTRYEIDTFPVNAAPVWNKGQEAGQNDVTITKGSWSDGQISFTKSAGTPSTKSVQLTAASTTWSGNTASRVIWDGTAADAQHGVSTGYTVTVDATPRYRAGSVNVGLQETPTWTTAPQTNITVSTNTASLSTTGRIDLNGDPANITRTIPISTSQSDWLTGNTKYVYVHNATDSAKANANRIARVPVDASSIYNVTASEILLSAVASQPSEPSEATSIGTITLAADDTGDKWYKTVGTVRGTTKDFKMKVNAGNVWNAGKAQGVVDEKALVRTRFTGGDSGYSIEAYENISGAPAISGTAVGYKLGIRGNGTTAKVQIQTPGGTKIENTDEIVIGDLYVVSKNEILATAVVSQPSEPSEATSIGTITLAASDTGDTWYKNTVTVRGTEKDFKLKVNAGNVYTYGYRTGSVNVGLQETPTWTTVPQTNITVSTNTASLSTTGRVNTSGSTANITRTIPISTSQSDWLSDNTKYVYVHNATDSAKANANRIARVLVDAGNIYTVAASEITVSAVSSQSSEPSSATSIGTITLGSSDTGDKWYKTTATVRGTTKDYKLKVNANNVWEAGKTQGASDEKALVRTRFASNSGEYSIEAYENTGTYPAIDGTGIRYKLGISGSGSSTKVQIQTPSGTKINNTDEISVGSLYTVGESEILVGAVTSSSTEPTATSMGSVTLAAGATGDKWYKSTATVRGTQKDYKLKVNADAVYAVTASEITVSAVASQSTEPSGATSMGTITLAAGATGDKWYKTTATVRGTSKDYKLKVNANAVYTVAASEITVSAVSSQSSEPSSATSIGTITLGSSDTGDKWYKTTATVRGTTKDYKLKVNAGNVYIAGQDNVTINKGSWSSGQVQFTKSAGTASTNGVKVGLSGSWSNGVYSYTINDYYDNTQGVSTGYSSTINAPSVTISGSWSNGVYSASAKHGTKELGTASINAPSVTVSSGTWSSGSVTVTAKHGTKELGSTTVSVPAVTATSWVNTTGRTWRADVTIGGVTRSSSTKDFDSYYTTGYSDALAGVYVVYDQNRRCVPVDKDGQWTGNMGVDVGSMLDAERASVSITNVYFTNDGQSGNNYTYDPDTQKWWITASLSARASNGATRTSGNSYCVQAFADYIWQNGIASVDVVYEEGTRHAAPYYNGSWTGGGVVDVGPLLDAEYERGYADGGGGSSYTRYTFSKSLTQSSDGYHYTFSIGTGWQTPFGTDTGTYYLYKRN